MAVKLTDRSGRPGVARVRRVDDASVRARSHRRRPELVSDAHRAPKNGGDSAVTRGYAPLVDVTFEPSIRPSAAPATAEPTPVSAQVQSAHSQRVLGSSDRSALDPMFDLAVAQAQDIATAVRRASHTKPDKPSAVTVPAVPVRHRLTLRGQRVLVVIGFVVAIVLGAVVGKVVGAEPFPVSTETHVVQSGESLWSIATGLAAPGQDVRPLVHRIAEANDLAGSTITPGQSLVVPAN